MDKFSYTHNDSPAPLFSEWWKTDNELWVRERKNDWKELVSSLFKNCSPADLSTYRRYFLTGEKRGYITKSDRLLLTPFESKDDVCEFVFNAKNKIFVQSEIQRVLVNYFEDTCRGSNASFYQDHAKVIAKAFYSGKYSEIMWEDLTGGILNVAPEPTAFVKNYCSNIVFYFKKEFAYTGNIECFDYFCSCLPEAKKTSMRKKLNKSGRLSMMFELATQVLKHPEGNDKSRTNLATRIIKEEDCIRESWLVNSKYDENQ